jgi:hypothetical protein
MTEPQAFAPHEAGELPFKVWMNSLLIPDDIRRGWHDLSQPMKQKWATVEYNKRNPTDKLPAHLAWDHYAATELDPMMPEWEALPAHTRMRWINAMQHAGITPTVDPTDPAEALRRMRAYSMCFTNAYDRKQMVFVLVEQDKTAWLSIAQWIKANIERLTDKHSKIISAKAIMMLFKQKADNNTGKDPD